MFIVVLPTLFDRGIVGVPLVVRCLPAEVFVVTLDSLCC